MSISQDKIYTESSAIKTKFIPNDIDFTVSEHTFSLQTGNYMVVKHES